MSKVYLVILEDRHTDVQVDVYRAKEDALARAEALTAQYRHVPEEQHVVKKWLYNRRLSEEGDAIRVEEAAVK